MNVRMYECVNVPIHIMHIFTQISLKQSKLLLGYGYLAEFVANDGKLIWGKPVDFIGNLCMSNYSEVQPLYNTVILLGLFMHGYASVMPTIILILYSIMVLGGSCYKIVNGQDY